MLTFNRTTASFFPAAQGFPIKIINSGNQAPVCWLYIWFSRKYTINYKIRNLSSPRYGFLKAICSYEFKSQSFLDPLMQIFLQLHSCLNRKVSYTHEILWNTEIKEAVIPYSLANRLSSSIINFLKMLENTYFVNTALFPNWPCTDSVSVCSIFSRFNSWRKTLIFG